MEWCTSIFRYFEYLLLPNRLQFLLFGIKSWGMWVIGINVDDKWCVGACACVSCQWQDWGLLQPWSYCVVQTCPWRCSVYVARADFTVIWLCWCTFIQGCLLHWTPGRVFHPADNRPRSIKPFSETGGANKRLVLLNLSLLEYLPI